MSKVINLENFKSCISILRAFLKMDLGENDCGVSVKPTLFIQQDIKKYDEIINSFGLALQSQNALSNEGADQLNNAIKYFIRAEFKNIWLLCNSTVMRLSTKIDPNNFLDRNQQRLYKTLEGLRIMKDHVEYLSVKNDLKIDFNFLNSSNVAINNAAINTDYVKYIKCMHMFNMPRLEGQVLRELLFKEMGAREDISQDQSFAEGTLKIRYCALKQASLFKDEEHSRKQIEKQFETRNESLEEHASDLHSAVQKK